MLLREFATRSNPTMPTLEGRFDENRQQFIVPGSGVLPLVTMGTGYSLTYSATTHTGKDNDKDDQGS